MAEINHLLDGIASGEIDKVSNKSLRKVIETAKKYGVEVVTEGLPPPPQGPGGAAAAGCRGAGGTHSGTITEPPWQENEGADAGAPPADVLDDINDVGEAVGDVQQTLDELEEVQEAIAEVRELIWQIHYLVGFFRISSGVTEGSMSPFRMSKEVVLTEAFKKEGEETERRDTERFVQEWFRQKEFQEDDVLTRLASERHWSYEVLTEIDRAGRQNREAPVSE